MSNNIYIASLPKEYLNPEFVPDTTIPEDAVLSAGGKTKTSFKKGHVPWNKGTSGLQDLTILQKARKKYTEEWSLSNIKKPYVGTWSPPVDNVSNLNKTNLTWPHCGKQGNVGNMKRWHFDKCKKRQ